MAPMYMYWFSLTKLHPFSHGYCRWSEMCGDIRFNLLNKPFGINVDSNMTDSKSRFMLKRFKVRVQQQKMACKWIVVCDLIQWDR